MGEDECSVVAAEAIAGSESTTQVDGLGNVGDMPERRTRIGIDQIHRRGQPAITERAAGERHCERAPAAPRRWPVALFVLLTGMSET